MRAIVVVPTYNELANLKTLVEKLQQYAPQLHILIVDDNSPDGTGRLADELRNSDPDRISVLHRERKEGLGRAYVDGFKEVLKKDYEYILQMDADLSHDPAHLPDFFAEIQNHDLVVGSRYLKGIKLCPLCHARAFHGCDEWFQLLAPGGAGSDQFSERFLQRLCLSRGAEIQSLSQRLSRKRSADHFY
jgi:glycosyltransferase involved in cell wall biosynthesis